MATKDYLDPRWQEKRLRVMDREKFTCQSCGAQDKTLHVHHRSYAKGKRIWDTPDDELVTLCEDCHESVEEMVREVRRIGDKIAFLESVGIAEFQITERLSDIVNMACNKPKWGAFALRTLDSLVVSLIQSSEDFEEAA